MTKPVRWLDDPSGAKAGARELLRAARPMPKLPDHVRAASREALRAHATQAASVSPAWKALVWKVGGGVALLALAGTFAWTLRGRLEDRDVDVPLGHERAASTPRATVTATPTPAPSSPPSVQPAHESHDALMSPAPTPVLVRDVPPFPAASASTRAIRTSDTQDTSERGARAKRSVRSAAATEHAPPAPTSAPVDTLAREVALLGSARARLPHAPHETLRLLAEHAHDFPEGQLAADRELLAIDALVRLGQSAAATERAAAFRARFTDVMYRERLEHLLARRAAVSIP